MGWSVPPTHIMHVQGALRVNRYNSQEAYVDNERLDAEVLISGRTAMNRGMDGDVVAIEILPQVLPSLALLGLSPIVIFSEIPTLPAWLAEFCLGCHCDTKSGPCIAGVRLPQGAGTAAQRVSMACVSGHKHLGTSAEAQHAATTPGIPTNEPSWRPRC